MFTFEHATFHAKFSEKLHVNLGKNQNGAVKRSKGQRQGTDMDTPRDFCAHSAVVGPGGRTRKYMTNSRSVRGIRQYMRKWQNDWESVERVWLRKNCHSVSQIDGGFSRESFSCSEMNGFSATRKETSGFAPYYLPAEQISPNRNRYCVNRVYYLQRSGP